MTITLWLVVALAAVALGFVIRGARRDSLKNECDRNAQRTFKRMQAEMRSIKRSTR